MTNRKAALWAASSSLSSYHQLVFQSGRVAVGVCGLLISIGGCDSVFGFEPDPAEPSRVRDLVMNEVATELVVDGDELFWLTAHAIRSCQLADCAPRTLLDNLPMPVALRVAGDQVEYADGPMIYRVPRLGGAPSVVVQAQNGHAITSFLRLLIHLFYTHDRITQCNYVPNGPCAADNSLFPEIVGPIAADATQRIWGAGPVAGGRWAMYVIVDAATTARDLQLVSTSSAPVRAIAASPPRVFAIQTTSDEVLEWPATAGPDTQPTVALVVPAASAIAVDASTVWVASTEGEVWRRRLLDGAGQAVLVAKDSVVIRALAVGTAVVVLALDDRIATIDVPSQ